MANDAALRTSLLWLAALILAVGICTHSFKKMMATYVFGLVAISGVLLPDWDYFNRDFSRWPYPVTSDERAASLSQGSGFLIRFANSPLRVIAYSVVYGYAIYRWWDLFNLEESINSFSELQQELRVFLQWLLRFVQMIIANN